MRKILFFVLLITAGVIADSCSRVPISHRRQVHLMPESELITMSNQQYAEVLRKGKVVPASDPRTQMVKRVGKRIQDAVMNYMNSHKKYQKRVRGFDWQFNLIDDKVANAWCMPGGKVAFYTGILPITKDETGMAVVMGHEIAHAIAKHGNERVSKQMALQFGGQAFGGLAGPEKAKVFQQVYGVSAGLAALKFSRANESEADHLGLVFMAMAGYDPKEAPKFWERMKSMAGNNVPQFLSTHPSHDSRIEDIKSHLPEALTYYSPK